MDIITAAQLEKNILECKSEELQSLVCNSKTATTEIKEWGLGGE